ncbi:aspartic protein nepenthesin-1-like [Dorcoceras hygrometricum]|uniref:Aspartic protein nepenthesin-1-like n=1 Tax=Dorcoceras hygrometricum TaxID=472368 RepID=A0A2Z7A3H1_9LAMI|nr:aspartic protein nepenthesin-1-like [Dorcoceras hygrometricum]
MNVKLTSFAEAGEICSDWKCVYLKDHALIPVGDPDPPPGQAAEEQNYRTGRRSIRKTNLNSYDIHRVFSVLPRWHLCLDPTGVSRTRLFSVDCGRFANPVYDQIRDSFVRLH